VSESAWNVPNAEVKLNVVRLFKVRVEKVIVSPTKGAKFPLAPPVTRLVPNSNDVAFDRLVVGLFEESRAVKSSVATLKLPANGVAWAAVAPRQNSTAAEAR
jgi:hypothetical protein